MQNIVANTPDGCQVNPDSPTPEAQGNRLSLIRDLLRDAIEESGWKHEALAAYMGLPNGAYLSQMLSGDKPIGTKHLLALPDDVEALFARMYAETFGLIVVSPVSADVAMRQLVSGLVGVLTSRSALPQKAEKMARAVERPAKRKVG